MTTIPMTARKAFRYANRMLRPGIEFSVKSERDARVLELLGRASKGVAPPPPPPAEPARKTRKPRAAETAALPLLAPPAPAPASTKPWPFDPAAAGEVMHDPDA